MLQRSGERAVVIGERVRLHDLLPHGVPDAFGGCHAA